MTRQQKVLLMAALAVAKAFTQAVRDSRDSDFVKARKRLERAAVRFAQEQEAENNMDPDANMREQEAILAESGRRRRLRELRDALLVWLQNHGVEPRWSEYPRAQRWYYGKYGGSLAWRRGANGKLEAVK